jgi:hypothetical protein
MRDAREDGMRAGKLPFRGGGGTVVAMRFIACLVSLVASGGLVCAIAWAPACALPSATSDAGTGTTDGASGGAQVTGAGCAQDPTTGVTLCQAVSLCPDLVIDTDLYPGCGFRVNGRVIDIECVCNDSVCPVGVPATCAQAKQLLGVQSAAIVCAQVNEGRCTSPASGGGGRGDAAASGCDRD